MDSVRCGRQPDKDKDAASTFDAASFMYLCAASQRSGGACRMRGRGAADYRLLRDPRLLVPVTPVTIVTIVLTI